MEAMPLGDKPKKSATVLEVYRMVLAQAQSWREASKEKARDKANREVCKALATELFTVAAHLEATEEVNPTKIQIDFYSERDLPNIGEVIERDGRKWRVVNNAIRNVSTAEIIN